VYQACPRRRPGRVAQVLLRGYALRVPLRPSSPSRWPRGEAPSPGVIRRPSVALSARLRPLTRSAVSRVNRRARRHHHFDSSRTSSSRPFRSRMTISSGPHTTAGAFRRPRTSTPAPLVTCRQLPRRYCVAPSRSSEWPSTVNVMLGHDPVPAGNATGESDGRLRRRGRGLRRRWHRQGGARGVGAGGAEGVGSAARLWASVLQG
jgi:hypothetical protein